MGSGVLLFDLKNWRRENIYERMLDVLEKKKNLRLPDQMLINNAIPERLMKVLPQKYNYVHHSYHPWQEYHWMRQYRIYSKQECREAIEHPVIIHYLTGWSLARPWHEDCYSHRKEEYYHYKALSPWKNTPLFPPIQQMYPPKSKQDKLYLWYLMQMMKPRPFILVWLLLQVLSIYGRIMCLMQGNSTRSDEGIEKA